MQTAPSSEATRPRPRLVDAIRRWLDNPDISGEMLAVLVALSDHADSTGACWPSQGHLARRLGWSRQRVGRIVAQLAAADLIRTRQLHRPDHGCSVLHYVIRDLTTDGSARPVPDRGQGGGTQRDRRTKPQNEELSLGARKAPTRADIDDAWRPDHTILERAVRERPDVDPIVVLSKFRAYHAGRSVLHPDRSFLLWVLREREVRNVKPTENRSRSSARTERGDPTNASDLALLRFRLRRGSALE